MFLFISQQRLERKKDLGEGERGMKKRRRWQKEIPKDRNH